jgi:redox-sensing transcriptional repressor
MADLEDVVAATGASIGVIATPAEVAQPVCDRLVAAGVRSILNFAPVALAVPAGVDVRHVDLSVELQVLAFLGSQRAVPSVEALA